MGAGISHPSMASMGGLRPVISQQSVVLRVGGGVSNKKNDHHGADRVVVDANKINAAWISVQLERRITGFNPPMAVQQAILPEAHTLPADLC